MTTLQHNDLITLWTMFVTYKCSQSIDVCLISDFEVAVYNILLPIACLVLEGEGKTWRTPESLEEAFNDCENGEIIMLLDERDQKTKPTAHFLYRPQHLGS